MVRLFGAVCLASLVLPASSWAAPAALPDLVGEILATSSSSTAVLVHGRVSNVGTAPYPGGAGLVLTADDGVEHYLVMPALGPGQEYLFNVALRSAQISTKVDLVVDPMGKVAELSRANNIAHWQVHPPLDLVLSSVRAEAKPVAGQPVYLVAEIRDRLWTPAVTVPVQVTMTVRSKFQIAGRDPIAIDSSLVQPIDFLDTFQLPISIDPPLLPAAQAADPTAPVMAALSVTVCVKSLSLVAEREDDCAGHPACNNCADLRVADVPLLRAPPAPSLPSP
ncbi:MAG: hypothetical protein GXP62_09140 [Oligoflexia bacterium]|nr:hypothetical protein [Oligoflexia bacterium]